MRDVEKEYPLLKHERFTFIMHMNLMLPVAFMMFSVIELSRLMEWPKITGGLILLSMAPFIVDE